MKSPSETRYSLIAKLSNASDVGAWNEFAQIYQPVIFQLVSERGLQYADATDVTQQVLTRVSQVVDQFDPERQGATFRGWLYRITQNLTMDFFRQQQRAGNKAVSFNAELDWGAIPQPSASDTMEFRTCFEQRLFVLASQVVRQRVADQTWQAFWRTEIEGHQVRDVAKSLQVSDGAVYVARSRVIASLKKEVQNRLNETGLH